MQGFQCASPEYTTAKLAMKEKDYPKAEEYLERELKKNPQNAEAWAYLAETKWSLKKFKEANSAATQAEKYAKNDLKLLYQVQNLKRKLWIDSYSGIIDNMNKYYNTKDASSLESALKNANTAIEIRPEIYEFYNLRGTIYDLMGSKDRALENYKEYEKMIKSSVDFAKENNIFIGADRKDVIKTIGQPKMSPGTKSPDGDSSITDIFIVNGKEFYLTTTNQKTSIFRVKNWRYDPPASLPETDRIYLFDLFKEPLVELVQFYFDKKEYEQSLYYLNEVLVLEPTNEPANNFLVTLYNAMGKKDEASKRFEDLIKKDPNNASYRLGYGNLLMQMDKYDEAIVEYNKALEIEPSYYDAMRNIASAYKNKAVLIQKRQKDAVDADATKKTTMKPDEYMPYIKLSAEFFEKCRKSPKYTNDIDVLSDLVDDFYVSGQTDKMKLTIAELESIEAIIPRENLERYYYQMLKIFQQRSPNAEKSKVYEDKINQLK